MCVPLPPPEPPPLPPVGQAVTANDMVIIASNAITLKNFVLFFIQNSFLRLTTGFYEAL
jgi:low affinity Fe/Cu permease